MLVCDTHCDALYLRAFEPEKTPRVTMEAMRRGGVGLQTCALFAGPRGVNGRPYQNALAQLAVLERLRREEGWTQAGSPLDAAEGETKILLSVEGGEIFEGSVERVREFAARGVRLAALTWNHENEIACPAKDGPRGGVKPAGWTILAEMARQRMAADVSHLNEQGFFELIERHSQPPMASHSCARALCGHFRNLTDEQIRALAARGGFIGVNFYPVFLTGTTRASVEDIVRHIDHMCQLGAQDIVGLGSDFDGIECAPEDCQSPAQIPAILAGLRRRGYSQAAVAGIAGGNFLAYCKRLGY